MRLAFYYISRCQNTQPELTHLNVSQKAPNQSLQLENTNFRKKSLKSEKLPRYKSNPYNIGKWDFHSTIFQSPKPLRLEWHTSWYHSSSHNLVSGNGKHQRSLKEINRIWKKKPKYYKNTSNTEKRVNHSTILRGVEIPHPQWDTQITIENHQIGPHNWKAVQNYESNQGYAARA